jgi:hypothetical protein
MSTKVQEIYTFEIYTFRCVRVRRRAHSHSQTYGPIVKKYVNLWADGYRILRRVYCLLVSRRGPLHRQRLQPTTTTETQWN